LLDFCNQSAGKTFQQILLTNTAKCGHGWLRFCSKNLIEFAAYMRENG